MDENTFDQEQEKIIISSNEFLIALDRLMSIYRRSMYHARAPHAHNRGQYRLLHIIAENDGLSQKELADILDVRAATLSELLDKLERSDLIKRGKDEVDRRKMRVFLSPGGKESVKSSQNQDDFAEELFGSLSDDEKLAFYNTIKKLCAHFEAQAILDGYDNDEPLPPHEREGHMPPPLPPHLRKFD